MSKPKTPAAIQPTAFSQLALPMVGQRKGRPATRAEQRGVPVFEVGDVVHWTSQAQGVSKTKQGVVQAIVPAGQRPDPTLFADLYKGPGAGWGRATVSYVIRVGRSRHFWPHAKLLRAGPAPEPAVDD